MRLFRRTLKNIHRLSLPSMGLASLALLIQIAKILAAGPEGPRLQEPARAQVLYTKYCAKCHKEDGCGKSKGRASDTPDLTEPTWQRGRSDIQLRVSIRDGKGRSMPGFGDRVNDKELKELVAYVRKFARANEPPSTKAVDGSFDARWQELEEEWQQQRREFWELHERAKEPK
jgi:mono/diheme cytochrome c family protein